jgi:hypothetical protein
VIGGQRGQAMPKSDIQRSKPTPRRESVALPESSASFGRKLDQRRTSDKRRAISPASTDQREAVRDRACVVCRQGPCDPAHVIDRSIGGDDHPDAVVPLCRTCHTAYDEGGMDLLPYLEPHYRDAQAYAVSLVGIARAYDRITNSRTVQPGVESRNRAA